MVTWYNTDTENYTFSTVIAHSDSFLIAESWIPHRIGIIAIKQSQMESNALQKSRQCLLN